MVFFHASCIHSNKWNSIWICSTARCSFFLCGAYSHSRFNGHSNKRVKIYEGKVLIIFYIFNSDPIFIQIFFLKCWSELSHSKPRLKFKIVCGYEKATHVRKSKQQYITFVVLFSTGLTRRVRDSKDWVGGMLTASNITLVSVNHEATSNGPACMHS
jgi:hypothetical protein